MAPAPSIIDLVRMAAAAADEKHGHDLLAIDVTSRFPLADMFLIVSGETERQVQAIADGIEDRLRAEGVKAVTIEGAAGGRWILMDFGGLLVHVQHEEERDFYQLERLWRDCPVVDVQVQEAR